MAVVGSADVLVRPSFKGFQTAARKAGLSAGGAAGQSLTSRMGSFVGKWAKRGLFAAGTAVGATFIGGVKSALDQQATTLILTGLYDDAELAKKTMQGLSDVIRQSPLSGSAFRKGAESLAYAGVQGDDVVRTLENVGKTIVGAGGTSESMDSFTNAMINGVNRGKFGLNELNQISKAGVPIFNSLGESLGVSEEELTKMASEGKIGLEEVVDVLENADTEAFQQSIRAGEEAQKSFLNSAKTLWNEVTDILGERLQPVLDWATDKFRDLAEKVGPALETFLDNATAKIKEFVQGWKDGEGPGGKFREVLTNLRDAAMDIWDVFQNKVLPVLKNVFDWLTSSPGIIKTVVGLFVAWKVAMTGWKLGVFVADIVKVTAGIVTQTGAIIANTAAWIASKAQTVALIALYAKDTAVKIANKVATLAAAGATKAMAAGQKVLNAVMRANPIGIVITVILALVAAFVTAYKNSETFRKIVDAAWEGIKTAAEWAWNFLKDYVFEPLKTAFKAVADAFVATKDALVNAWDNVKDSFLKAWDLIWNTMLVPLRVQFEALKTLFNVVKSAITGDWEGVKDALVDGWNRIKDIVVTPFQAVWEFLEEHFSGVTDALVTAWDWVKEKFLLAWDFLQDYVFEPIISYYTMMWEAAVAAKDFVVGAWEKIKEGALVVWDFLKKYVFKPITKYYETLWGIAIKAKDFIVGAWDKIYDGAMAAWGWLRDKVFTPLGNKVDDMKAWFRVAKDVVTEQWDTLKENIRKPYDWLRDNVFDKLKKLIKTTIPNAFEDGKDAIKKAWDKVKNIAKTPVNFLIGTVYNSGIRKMWNKVATKFGGAELPRVQKLATGGPPVGPVSGPGGPTADRVPAMLSHGEHVWSAREVDALGGHGKVAQMRAMARAGQIPAFSIGGWLGDQWGHFKRGVSATWNTTTDFAKHLDDPIGWIKEKIKTPVAALGDGPFPDMLKKIPTAILDGLEEKFKDKFFSGETQWADGFLTPMKGQWTRPSSGPITSEFGYRTHPVTGARALHAGIDIGGGGPTYAAARGRVTHTGFHPLSGYNITLRHERGDVTKYFHNPSMAAIRVRPGDAVEKGQHIGQQGATGRVTGTHLHFEYHQGGRAVNPRNLGIFDNGGLLQPGALAYHSSTMSKPDAVLTSSQWAAISKLAGSNSQGGPTYNAYISPQSGGSPDEIADSVLYSMRRLQRGGVHAR